MMKEFIIDIDVGVVNYAPIIKLCMLDLVFLLTPVLLPPPGPTLIFRVLLILLVLLVVGFLGGDPFLPKGEIP